MGNPIRILLVAFAVLTFGLLAVACYPASTYDSDSEAEYATTASVDEVIRTLYETISGPAGGRDWERFRSLHHPDARLTPLQQQADGSFRSASMPVEQFIDGARAFFLENAFHESEIARRTEIFGNLAHVFSSYESRTTVDSEPFERGINSIQLVREDGRWLILQAAWQPETDDLSIPDRYLMP